MQGSRGKKAKLPGKKSLPVFRNVVRNEATFRPISKIGGSKNKKGKITCRVVSRGKIEFTIQSLLPKKINFAGNTCRYIQRFASIWQILITACARTHTQGTLARTHKAG